MSFFTDANQGVNTGEPKPEDKTTDFMERIKQEKGENFDVAKGYVNSQDHIKELERQTAELREDLAKKDYAEKLLMQLREQAPTPPVTSSTPNDPQAGTGTEVNTTPQVSETDLESLINKTLTEREKANTANQNLATTDAKLTEMFGTEVEKVVQERSSVLGMSKERLQEIASESPTAFFALIGEETPKESNPTLVGTVNTSAGFVSQASPSNTYSAYQKMRRENPRQYYLPKVQNQMLKDREELGDKFYN